MSILLAGARLAAPVQMGPAGGSGGCLAFAGTTAKRKVVRLAEILVRSVPAKVERGWALATVRPFSGCRRP